jgi:hypothetical protein
MTVIENCKEAFVANDLPGVRATQNGSMELMRKSALVDLEQSHRRNE